MPLSQAEPYLDHLTSCSPCYRDFSQRREAYRVRRTRMLLAVAASLLIAAALTTWAIVRRQSNVQVARSVVVDLRDRSMARGTEPPPSEPPIEIGRNVSRLNIYLPLGTSDGPYEIRITTAKGDPLFTGSALATVEAGTTSLQVDASLSSASPGLYVLQIRRVGSDWNSYSVRIG